jgi:hypothetical protein
MGALRLNDDPMITGAVQHFVYIFYAKMEATGFPDLLLKQFYW